MKKMDKINKSSKYNLAPISQECLLRSKKTANTVMLRPHYTEQ